MIRNLDTLAKQYGLDPEGSDRTKKKIQHRDLNQKAQINDNDVPMMYRAQTEGRCHLQYANDNLDLKRWSDEWITLDRYHPGHAIYQRVEPPLGLQDSIYRIKIQFPFRVFSNCGQDSIHRPVLGKNGIPFIPGSSIKGLFRRLLYTPNRSADSRQRIEAYCGSADKPGTLRFHGAYPVGEWAGAKQVVLWKKGARVEETHYQVVDLVHPQEKRQVEEVGHGKTSAYALISLYQPMMIFELSSSDSDIDWKEVEGLFKTALRPGLGGKTSTGYGLAYLPKDKYSFSIRLHGTGVTSQLPSGEPEFRPNLFKATLRSHIMRLLGGVYQDSNKKEKSVRDKVAALFGSSSSPGSVEIFWEAPLKQVWETTYDIRGTLNINALEKDLEFLKWVLKFAYVMGGFGKSWRRVDHNRFYRSDYGKQIGCHWECDPDGEFTDWLTDIKSSKQLTTFLDDLQKQCCQYTQVQKSQSLIWKEAWHPGRVAVYSQVVDTSQAIHLFHDPTFKTTPAIGGKNSDDDHPTHVSSVWHRMLPIGNNQYLEIVTVFHGDREPWQHETGGDQLQPFIQKLKENQLAHTWGTNPCDPHKVDV